MFFFFFSVSPRLGVTTPDNSKYDMTCSVTKDGVKVFRFLRGSTPVYTGSSSTFTIATASASDSGDYTCVAYINGVESSASNAFTLSSTVGK